MQPFVASSGARQGRARSKAPRSQTGLSVAIAIAIARAGHAALVMAAAGTDGGIQCRAALAQAVGLGDAIIVGQWLDQAGEGQYVLKEQIERAATFIVVFVDTYHQASVAVQGIAGDFGLAIVHPPLRAPVASDQAVTQQYSAPVEQAAARVVGEGDMDQRGFRPRAVAFGDRAIAQHGIFTEADIAAQGAVAQGNDMSVGDGAAAAGGAVADEAAARDVGVSRVIETSAQSRSGSAGRTSGCWRCACRRARGRERGGEPCSPNRGARPGLTAVRSPRRWLPRRRCTARPRRACRLFSAGR